MQQESSLHTASATEEVGALRQSLEDAKQETCKLQACVDSLSSELTQAKASLTVLEEVNTCL